MHFNINKYVVKEKVQGTIFGVVFTVIAFLIIGLVMEYALPLYKPSKYTCSDVAFKIYASVKENDEDNLIEIPSYLNRDEQQYFSKKFLGREFELLWFENYVKLIIHVSDSRTDTLIFSKVHNDYYSHHSEDGGQQSLIVHRDYGLLRSIYIDSWSSSQFSSSPHFIYRLTLKP